MCVRQYLASSVLLLVGLPAVAEPPAEPKLTCEARCARIQEFSRVAEAHLESLVDRHRHASRVLHNTDLDAAGFATIEEVLKELSEAFSRHYEFVESATLTLRDDFRVSCPDAHCPE